MMHADLGHSCFTGDIFSSLLPFGNHLNIIWQSFGPANRITQAFKGVAYLSILGQQYSRKSQANYHSSKPMASCKYYVADADIKKKNNIENWIRGATN